MPSLLPSRPLNSSDGRRNGDSDNSPAQLKFSLIVWSSKAMSHNDVRTSSVDRSIWLDLPEETFRQHLVALEDRTNAVPIDAQAFVPGDWLKKSRYAAQSSYSFPLAVEQQVADDFACLVAVEEGAQSVAAVCIEEHTLLPGLTLRFAALDISLDNTVKAALQEAIAILAKAASFFLGERSDNPYSFHLPMRFWFGRHYFSIC